MRYLTREQVLRFHASVIGADGGILGIRDSGMLDAALKMPEATFDGGLLHPDVPSATAAYLFHICQNHPFFDGNKRVATLAACVFLRANGYALSLDNDDLADLVLDVAGGKVNKRELTARLRAAIVKV